MMATINSRAINGNGMPIGNKPYIVAKTLSPAKILPKSLKEKDMNLVNSFASSKMPTKRKIPNIFKEKNLDKYAFMPACLMPR
jgi:hypothetical protein